MLKILYSKVSVKGNKGKKKNHVPVENKTAHLFNSRRDHDGQTDWQMYIDKTTQSKNIDT